MRHDGPMTDARAHPGLWVAPDADPRTQRLCRGERETLLDYLDNYRLTFAMKCEGLTPAQLATRSVPPSTLSLLGLLRHLARVEHSWFRRVMQRNLDLERIYGSVTEPDVAFDEAVGTQECCDEAWSRWRAEVAHAQEFAAAAESLDLLGTHPDGEIELRDVLVHLIEEYARHCGHADLLRECLDGRTGQ